MTGLQLIRRHTDSLLDETPSQQTDSETAVEETETEDDTETSSPPAASEPDSDQDTQEGYELPLDQIFELLKNTRRRRVLHYLHENGGETTLSEVAEHIAALENETTVKAISSAQRKRVYVGLYQCHLPKMDDTDVVAFDQNRGTIELGPNAAQLDPYLESPEKQEWHKLYLGVTLGSFGLFGYSQVGGASIGLTPTVVLVLTLVGVTACILAHSLATSNKYS